MDEINKFAEVLQQTEGSIFSRVKYTPYLDNNGGEICVTYNNADFSIQLFEDDGDIEIDIDLIAMQVGHVEVDYNDLGLKFEHVAYLSNYDSIEEAVVAIATEIVGCEVPQRYAKIQSIINVVMKNLSPSERDEFIWIFERW